MQYNNAKLVSHSQGSAIPGLLSNIESTDRDISVGCILIKLRLVCPTFFIYFHYRRDCYDSFGGVFFISFIFFFFVRLDKPYSRAL